MIKNWFLLLYIIFIGSLTAGQIVKIPFLLPNSFIYLHDVFLTCLWIAWLVFHFKNRQVPVRVKLYLPLGLVIAAMASSLIINFKKYPTEQFVVAFFYFFRWVFYAGLYVITVDLIQKKIIRRSFIVYSLLFTGWIIALIGFFQLFLYPSLRNLIYLGWDEHFYRIFSTLLDPNFAGIIIVLAFLIGINVVLGRKNLLITLFILVPLFVALLLTYSRSSYVAFVTGLVTSLAKKQNGICLFLLCLFFISVFILPRPSGEGVKMERTSTVIARLRNAQEVFQIIRSAPVFGVGFDAYRYARLKGRTVDAAEVAISHSGAGADNSYLFIWATTGIVGLSAFVLLWWKAIWVGKMKNRLLLASLVSVSMHALFINSWFYPLVMIWIWLEVAVVESDQGA